MVDTENIFRCSTCKLKYFESYFGKNRLNNRFKTCPKCRKRNKNEYNKRKNKTASTTEPENDELQIEASDNSVVEETENNEHVNDQTINDTQPETNRTNDNEDALHDERSFIDNYLGGYTKVDILDLVRADEAYDKFKKVRHLITDRENLINTLTSYNLDVLPLDDNIINSIHSCYCSSQCALEILKENIVYIAGIRFVDKYNIDHMESKGVKDLKILFSPDNVHIFAADIPSIDIFKGFFTKTKNKGKRRCEICLEKTAKRSHDCGNCQKRICQDCYIRMTTNKICPYCRYTLHQHMMKSIAELDIKELIFEF